MKAKLLEGQSEIGANHPHGERKMIRRCSGRKYFAVCYLRDIRDKSATRSGKWRKPHPTTWQAYPNDSKRGLPKLKCPQAIHYQGDEYSAWQRSRRSSPRALTALTWRRTAVYLSIQNWEGCVRHWENPWVYWKIFQREQQTNSTNFSVCTGICTTQNSTILPTTTSEAPRAVWRLEWMVQA